jgi:hypothetical protein
VGIRGNFAEVSPLLPLDFQGLGSSHQAWLQVPSAQSSPHSPSTPLSLTINVSIISILIKIFPPTPALWQKMFLFFFFDIFFIYVSNVILFPSFPAPPPRSPLSHSLSPCFYEGAPPPTSPLPPPRTSISLHWDIEPSLDQRPLLPLMPNKVILWYICSWSYGSLPVYLDSSLVPGSSGGSGWLILLFFLWGCKQLQLLQSFL